MIHNSHQDFHACLNGLFSSMTAFCRALPASSRQPILIEAREAQSASVIGHQAHARLRAEEEDGPRLLTMHKCLTEVKPLSTDAVASILTAMRDLSTGDCFNASSFANIHVSELLLLSFILLLLLFIARMGHLVA